MEKDKLLPQDLGGGEVNSIPAEDGEGDGIKQPFIVKDGISYWTMQPKHEKETLALVQERFSEGEILGQLGGLSKEAVYELQTLMWPAVVDCGITVVAVDDATGKVCGTFTAVDEATLMWKVSWWQMIKFGYKNSDTLKVFEIVDQINEPVYEEHKRLIKQKKAKEKGFAADFFCVAVHKDYGRRGIGANCTKYLERNAKKAGFQMGYAQCTSQFSKKAMEKAGFTVEKVIEYKEYKIIEKGGFFGCMGRDTTTYPLSHATDDQPNISLLVKRFNQSDQEKAD